MAMAPYVKELQREVVLATVRALSADAASKADRRLAQVRRRSLGNGYVCLYACMRLLRHLLRQNEYTCIAVLGCDSCCEEVAINASKMHACSEQAEELPKVIMCIP